MPPKLKEKLNNNLHSTLFILKLLCRINCTAIQRFTFYFIYIKTCMLMVIVMQEAYLHSTLFILKLNKCFELPLSKKDLHSTLFILKRKVVEFFRDKLTFTFYFIYIKTVPLILMILDIITFTFYFIYIKTGYSHN